MKQDERVRLQVEIDRSLRDEITVLLRDKYGRSNRGLSLVIRAAIIDYLKARGYLKPKVVQTPD